MTITVTQLHPHIGAEIGGLDLREPADAATVEALWEAIDRHAVLVFHDQQLSDEQLRSFARRFGELEIGRSAARGGRRRLSRHAVRGHGAASFSVRRRGDRVCRYARRL